MTIFQVEFETWDTIAVRLNYVVLIILGILVVGGIFLYKYFFKKKTLRVEESDLGIGDDSMQITYNRKAQQFAYKLWVELSTRQISDPFDSDRDLIADEYDSWNDFSAVARDLMKKIPAGRRSHAKDLIFLTEKVLSKGLSAHLTEWQAKYRRWYDNALADGENQSSSPQEIQKKYPEYDNLVEDMMKTKQGMIQYKELMYRIAFGK